MKPENNSSLRRIESERLHLDPLETSQDDFDDRDLLERANWQKNRIDNILQKDETLSWEDKNKLYRQGCEIRLEWLYAKHGGASLDHNQFNDSWDEANKFFIAAGRHAAERRDHEPQAYWDLTAKYLDLRALQAHRFSQDAETTLKGSSEQQKARNVADEQMKGVIKDGVRLMHSIAKFSNGPTELASNARGKLYELMLINYTRLRIFEDDTYGQIMVRSALQREDEPINGYAYPKRAFDMVIQNGHHNTLVQAKNHDDTTRYKAPIIKIEDHNFHKTLKNMPQHLKDFRLLVANSSDPHTQHILEQAHRQLDGVFGRQLEAAFEDSGIIERQGGAADAAAAFGQLAVSNFNHR